MTSVADVASPPGETATCASAERIGFLQVRGRAPQNTRALEDNLASEAAIALLGLNGKSVISIKPGLRAQMRSKGAVESAPEDMRMPMQIVGIRGRNDADRTHSRKRVRSEGASTNEQ